MRFHLNCAKKLSDLNDYEYKLLFQKLNKSNSESKLQDQVKQLLHALEGRKLLTYLRVTIGLFKDATNNDLYRIGREGFSDYILFLPNGKTIFIELKQSKSNLYKSQEKFKILVENLGYKYIMINDIITFKILLHNKYNIKNTI